MTQQLAFDDVNVESFAVSPFHEMGAYEALWCRPRTTFRTLAHRFAESPGSLPSDFVAEEEAAECAQIVQDSFRNAGVLGYGVRVNGAGEYPSKLRDATHPVELLYYQGWWDIVASPSIAVVGTRKPSNDGLKRTQQVVRELVGHGYTVVSGLAAGIDRTAHETAIGVGGRTIAVIGTPLNHSYPRENSDLQRQIADNFLVMSQVPVKRYEERDYRHNRSFFPERNITMSALTEATIIIEAGETSGTLIQARAAIRQNRKLFVLESSFHNPNLTWPARLEAQGAIRVKNYDDIRKHLPGPIHQDR